MNHLGSSTSSELIGTMWESGTKKNLLSPELYLISKRYLQENPDLSFLPTADPASTKVFFPPDLPVVFKQSGEKKSIDRFFRMCQIRGICEKKSYTRLIVPRAGLHGPFIIEEKLPLKELSQKGQIGLYSENYDKFSQAVREFTGLLSQTFYSDILTFSHPYQQRIPLGRYDNIPFFLEGDIGKIGLVDLEEAEERREKITQEDLFRVAQTAISLFPLHFYEILSVLQEDFPEIFLNREELERYHKDVLENFSSIYQDHYAFIARKGSRIDFPFFSTQRKEELEEIAGSHLAMRNLIQKIVENIEQAVHLVDVQELSIAHVLARTITLSITDLTEEKEPQQMIMSVLEELKRREEICFANIYFNRALELRVRIHF